jgi:biotin synthase
MLKLRFEHDEILSWLRQRDANALERLFDSADHVRAAAVGPDVHLRALVEISNHCVRLCTYCGLRAGNADLPRYRMTSAEIMECVRQADGMNYGTVVLQAGEDPGIARDWMADLICKIKHETPLAVTLSLGERTADELRAWREAGADRYLLRFETSDRRLYEFIHPRLLPDRPSDRIAILKQLRELDYEIGSGIMIGIPGQSLASIADDILLFRELDLDMIGVGPYIPHPCTPLGKERCAPKPDKDEQASGDELTVYKVIALTRLACPEANIPSTTALATINTVNGRELGLQRGANVVMPNLTPPRYRALYEIYPNKACIDESGQICNNCLQGRISKICRRIGMGPGGRQRNREISQPIQ